jgi:hypothetical protein
MLLIVTVELLTHDTVEWGIGNMHIDNCGSGKKLTINSEASGHEKLQELLLNVVLRINQKLCLQLDPYLQKRIMF